MPEPYDPNFYIPREEEQTLLQWLDQPPQRDGRRLCSLVGSAGIGKSWLLARLHAQASTTNDYLIFWADAPKHLSSENAFQKWLEQTLLEARGAGLSVSFDPYAQMSLLVKQLAIQACVSKADPPRWPLLLIDQSDELSAQALKHILERSLLQPILEQWCVRAIVTLRNEKRLTHPYLKRRELPLPVRPWSAEKGRTQLLQRAPNFDLDSQVPGYEPLRPGVNTWLANRAKESGLLTVADIQTCLRDWTKDIAGNLLADEALADVILLNNRAGWTIEEFSQEVHCPASEAMRRLGFLTDRAILMIEGACYSLPIDLRGLISAYKRRVEQ